MSMGFVFHLISDLVGKKDIIKPQYQKLNNNKLRDKIKSKYCWNVKINKTFPREKDKQAVGLIFDKLLLSFSDRLTKTKTSKLTFFLRNFADCQSNNFSYL